VYRVAKRIHAVLLNHEGHTSGQIAGLLKAPRSRVSQWLQHYQSFGDEALLEGHRCGRPPRLDGAQLRQLADIVESGPVAYGYLSGVWTSVMIATVIQEEFGVRYDPRHVRRVLDKLGFSLQRPKRQLARADPAAQDRWRRYTYPNLKKKPAAKGRP
jgi:transposase